MSVLYRCYERQRAKLEHEVRRAKNIGSVRGLSHPVLQTTLTVVYVGPVHGINELPNIIILLTTLGSAIYL